ncbi:hypothetical protein B0A48_13209 [Cryoendolithus antarcticus]|uniref:Methyltransferase domain-containing protein n=1 Tax=Cryoendolithus antarcticus TaxID=1507870 RepID=A0A1V8SNV4_9PEZI|nr:hypothetical protein B0A48_13209 [Cryoendolithus antarcticus]
MALASSAGQLSADAVRVDRTQFANIAGDYVHMPLLPEGRVAEYTIRKHLSGIVHGRRVLDLACGTGRWSRFALELGAGEVVGVDISSTMIANAQTLSQTASAPRNIEYVIGDASKTLVGPAFTSKFDVALAMCFLNYARNEIEIFSMWQVMASNVSEGGRLVALVPSLDLADDYSTPIDPRYGTSFRRKEAVNVGAVDWGYKTTFLAATSGKSIEFDMYRLNREVYLRAAHGAGFQDVKFHDMQYPDCNDAEYWDEYKRRPHYEILTAIR